MRADFTMEDAEGVMRRLQPLLPKGVDVIVIFASPPPEGVPGTILNTFTTIEPSRAYAFIVKVATRFLTGTAEPPVKLGRLQ